MFSKADNYMSGGVFSLLLRVVNIHILVIHTCKKIWYCFIFYEILRLAIWVKILFDVTFSCIPLTGSFCVNEYILKFFTKTICNIFSGRFDVHLQVIQPILKIPYLIWFIKHPKYVIWNKKNHLKECHLWLTLKWIRQNTAFHRCLH